jgi:hypothetical protein
MARRTAGAHSQGRTAFLLRTYVSKLLKCLTSAQILMTEAQKERKVRNADWYDVPIAKRIRN